MPPLFLHSQLIAVSTVIFIRGGSFLAATPSLTSPSPAASFSFSHLTRLLSFPHLIVTLSVTRVRVRPIFCYPLPRGMRLPAWARQRRLLPPLLRESIVIEYAKKQSWTGYRVFGADIETCCLRELAMTSKTAAKADDFVRGVRGLCRRVVVLLPPVSLLPFRAPLIDTRLDPTMNKTLRIQRRTSLRTWNIKAGEGWQQSHKLTFAYCWKLPVTQNDSFLNKCLFLLCSLAIVTVLCWISGLSMGYMKKAYGSAKRFGSSSERIQSGCFWNERNWSSLPNHFCEYVLMLMIY